MTEKEVYKNKEALIQCIKSTLNTSRIALELDASECIEEKVYNEQDCFNISILFMHVIGNFTAAHCKKQNFTAEQSYILAEELGKSIHQTIKLFTGIDTKQLANEMTNEAEGIKSAIDIANKVTEKKYKSNKFEEELINIVGLNK